MKIPPWMKIAIDFKPPLLFVAVREGWRTLMGIQKESIDDGIDKVVVSMEDAMLTLRAMRFK